MSQDGFGQVHVGTQAEIDYYNTQYNNAVGDNIRGGFFGALFFKIGGAKASFSGAAFDQAAQAAVALNELKTSYNNRPGGDIAVNEAPANVETSGNAQPDEDNYTFNKASTHFIKHESEWSEQLSPAQYFIKATQLAKSSIGGDILSFTSEEGYIFKYNQATNEFLDIDPQGNIETFFRPKNGIDYYNNQLKKYGN